MGFTKVTDTYTLSNGVKIPCVGFGTWRVPDGDVAYNAVAEALRAGYRHIDTAAMYKNEKSVGAAINESGIPREEIFVTSKLDNPSHGYEETREAFEQTMSDLNMDYVDLYLIHWPNPISVRDHWKEANAGSWRAMEEFYEAGRIRALGVSNFSAHHIAALLETARIRPVVNQISLSPGLSQPGICKASREAGMLLEAYTPLGKGVLLKKPEMTAIADKHGRTAAQIAIAWSLKMGFLPLPKSITPERIRSNMDVFGIELDEEDMAVLNSISREDYVLKDPDEITF